MSQAYVLTCADGKRIALQMSSPDKFWKGLAAVIEVQDLLVRYPDRKSRVANYEAIGQELAEIFVRKPRSEWLDRLAQQDVPYAPESTFSESSKRTAKYNIWTFSTILSIPRWDASSIRRAIRCDDSREMEFRPPPPCWASTRVKCLLKCSACR